jgi:hypothetical protein
MLYKAASIKEMNFVLALARIIHLVLEIIDGVK